ncbi:hypothetical protein acsn021_06380 [Anaerocolumna cellulosilytica]|uniref:Uncharacterized protein n=1 Tax=Anaerocolumna cellulosilytica TaxID=433286 RepID=A0A6S6QVF6_9FIRM|nr:hypothetical protein [Anaerocolumna cellulosilytica]MBB5198092.1 hypothetical protein [Anaerocolumna cellulosilytica]BCJ93069.1 hypothetical protein acsn021_06380 [Anaerocolumna cellulosilytica]
MTYNMKTSFDKQATYNDTIKQKVQELQKLCILEKLPMFLSICTKNDEDTTWYENIMISPETMDLDLSYNVISKMVLCLNDDFKIVPKSDIEVS